MSFWLFKMKRIFLGCFFVILCFTVRHSNASWDVSLPNYGGCNQLEYGKAVLAVVKCTKNLFGFSYFFSTFQQRASKICSKKRNVFKCFDKIVNLNCWTDKEKEGWTTGLQAFGQGVDYLCEKNRKHVKEFFKARGFWCLTTHLLNFLGCKPLFILTRASLHDRDASKLICSTGDCMKNVFAKCSEKASAVATNAINRIQNGLQCHGTDTATSVPEVVISSDGSHGVAGSCTAPYLKAVSEVRSCVSSQYKFKFKQERIKQRFLATCRKIGAIMTCTNSLVAVSCWKDDEKVRWKTAIASFRSAFDYLCAHNHKNLKPFINNRGFDCMRGRFSVLKECVPEDFFNTTSFHSNETTSPFCGAADCISAVMSQCKPQAVRIAMTAINTVRNGVSCPVKVVNVTLPDSPSAADHENVTHQFGDCTKEEHMKSLEEVKACVSQQYPAKMKFLFVKNRAVATCQEKEELSACLQNFKKLSCWSDDRKQILTTAVTSLFLGVQFLCKEKHVRLNHFYRGHGFSCLKNHKESFRECLSDGILDGTFVYSNHSNEVLCSAVACLQSVFHDCSKKASLFAERALNIVGSNLNCQHSNASHVHDSIAEDKMVGSCDRTTYLESVEQTKTCFKSLFGYKLKVKNFSFQSRTACRKNRLFVDCPNHIINLSCWTEDERNHWKKFSSSIKSLMNFFCGHKERYLKRFLKFKGFACVKAKAAGIESCISDIIHPELLSLHSEDSRPLLCSAGDCIKTALEHGCTDQASNIAINAVHRMQATLTCNSTILPKTELSTDKAAVHENVTSLFGNCTKEEHMKSLEEVKACVSQQYPSKMKFLFVKNRAVATCQKRKEISACLQEDFKKLSCWSDVGKQILTTAVTSLFHGVQFLCKEKHVRLNHFYRGHGFSCLKNHKQSFRECLSDGILDGTFVYSNHSNEVLCSAVACLQSVFHDCSKKASFFAERALHIVGSNLNCTHSNASHVNDTIGEDKMVGSCDRKTYLESVEKTKTCFKSLFVYKLKVKNFSFQSRTACRKNRLFVECPSHIINLSCWSEDERNHWKKFSSSIKSVMKFFCGHRNKYLKRFLKFKGFACVKAKASGIESCISDIIHPELLSLHSDDSRPLLCSAGDCIKTAFEHGCTAQASNIAINAVHRMQATLACNSTIVPKTELSTDKDVKADENKIGSCPEQEYRSAMNNVKKCFTKSYKLKLNLFSLQNFLTVTCSKNVRLQTCMQSMTKLKCWNGEEKGWWTKSIKKTEAAIQRICHARMSFIKYFFRFHGLHCLKRQMPLIKGCFGKNVVDGLAMNSEDGVHEICSSLQCVKTATEGCNRRAKLIGGRVINIVQTKLECHEASTNATNTTTTDDQFFENLTKEKKMIGNCTYDAYEKAVSTMMTCFGNHFKYKFRASFFKYRSFLVCRKRQEFLACSDSIMDMSCWNEKQLLRWRNALAGFNSALNFMCSANHKRMKRFFRSKGFFCVKKRLGLLANCLHNGNIVDFSLHSDSATHIACSAGDCLKDIIDNCSPRASKIGQTFIDIIQKNVQCTGSGELARASGETTDDNEANKPAVFIGGCRRRDYLRALSKMKICIANLYKYKFKFYFLRHRAMASCRKSQKIIKCTKEVTSMSCWTPEAKKRWAKVEKSLSTIKQLMCSKRRRVLRYFFRNGGFRCIRKNFNLLKSCLPETPLNEISVQDEQSRDELCQAGDCVKAVFKACSKPVSKLVSRAVDVVQFGVQCEEIVSSKIDPSIDVEDLKLETPPVGGCNFSDYEAAVAQFRQCTGQFFKYEFKVNLIKHRTTVVCQKRTEIFSCTKFITDLKCWSGEEQTRWTSTLASYQSFLDQVCSKDMKLINNFFNHQGFYCIKNSYEYLESCLPLEFSGVSLHSDSSIDDICSIADCVISATAECTSNAALIFKTLMNSLKVSMRCKDSTSSNGTSLASLIDTPTDAPPLTNETEGIKGRTSTAPGCSVSRRQNKADQCIQQLVPNVTLADPSLADTACGKKEDLLSCVDDVKTLPCFTSLERDKWENAIEVFKKSSLSLCSNPKRVKRSLDCLKDHEELAKSCLPDNQLAGLSFATDKELSLACSASDCLKSAAELCDTDTKNFAQELLDGLETELNCSAVIPTHHLIQAEKLKFVDFVGGCDYDTYNSAVSKFRECFKGLYENSCQCSNMANQAEEICRRRLGVKRCAGEITKLRCWDAEESKKWDKAVQAIDEGLHWLCTDGHRNLKEFNAAGGFRCLNDSSIGACQEKYFEDLPSFHSQTSTAVVCKYGECLKSSLADCSSSVDSYFIDLVRSRLGCSEKSSSGSAHFYTYQSAVFSSLFITVAYNLFFR